MSNRGNQDHYKISGTPTRQRDLIGLSHRAYGKQQAAERDRPHRAPPGSVEAAPVFRHAPPRFKEAEAPPAIEREERSRMAPPSLGEAARMAAGGVWKLGTWAAGVTWRYGTRTLVRRLERLFERRRHGHEAPVP